MSSTESKRPHDSLIDHAYNTDHIRELTEIWRDRLVGHLAEVMSGAPRVLQSHDPESLIRHAAAMLAEPVAGSKDNAEQFSELVETTLRHGQHLHHPRYIGHQVPASVPAAGLFDAIGSVTNQPMAIFEMGPWATAAEIAVVQRLCAKIGWDPAASAGLLTSGGSLANLTALLTARNVAFPDSWQQGIPSNACLVAQADAHYCVMRAAGILGLGTDRVVRAPLGDRRRLDPDQLDQLLHREKTAGRTVIAVVACAGATPTGAFDPLDAVADVCRRHNVWLHVDAAHGGGVLMSPKHRHLLDGIQHADSVVWDAHKMMFVPALCGAVLYREKRHQFTAFQQDAPYLFDPLNPGNATFDVGVRTLECTKRGMSLGLWGTWALYGDSLFASLVDRAFDQARFFHQLLTAADDFEPLHVPEANIVVFRHLPPRLQREALDAQNSFQLRLRQALVKSGSFYIVQTVLDGTAALRVTMMNPQTSDADLSELLETLRKTAQELL